MQKFQDPSSQFDRRLTQQPVKSNNSRKNNAGSMVSLTKNHQNSSVGGAPGAGSATFGSLDKLDLS